MPGPRARVAVIGGGIAGVGAAWSLKKAGFDVALFEQASQLGGNARSFRWPLAGEPVETPLFVHAWPAGYYHNYEQLLGELGVETTTMPIRYYVSHPGGVFRQDSARDHQLERWRRLVGLVARTNHYFNPVDPSRPKSLYEFSYFNPMNLIPLYGLARLFGISERFWRQVFVPVHCATFITTRLTGIPAVILPLLEDIVPLERPGTMTTWRHGPREVFEKMARGLTVHTDTRILLVQESRGGHTLRDQRGRLYAADEIVFAVDARSALNAIASPTCLEKTLLAQVDYVDDDDPTFAEAIIHNDPTVIPREHRRAVLEGYNTYTQIHPGGGLECTFVLGPHTPALKATRHPCFVTFNASRDLQAIRARISLTRSTHCLSLKNLIIMMLLRRIQGSGGRYFCSSYTTPEGGHDLSLLSGFVVAETIGAPYPLDPANRAATEDFARLRQMMLGV